MTTDTDWLEDGIDYPDLSALEQKRRLKAPKATKASHGHDIRSKEVEEPKEPFKMKRFSKVESRVKFG